LISYRVILDLIAANHDQNWREGVLRNPHQQSLIRNRRLGYRNSQAQHPARRLRQRMELHDFSIT